MRTAFLSRLTEIAREDPNLFLLTGDLGFSVLEPFAQEFPDRFINVGVAEANMAGIAAGLAMGGKHVYIYSIANFPTLRCLEQIRNDICYHNLNVTVVAVGAGLSYGQLGYSHHGLEDIAAMRALPNLTLLSPADPGEVSALIPCKGPTYLRLGKAGESQVHSFPVYLNQGTVIKHGTRATIIATGSITKIALDIPDTTLISMSTLSPIDRKIILEEGAKTGHVITLEEHGRGGLASIVAEILATESFCGEFTPFYIKDPPTPLCGSQDYLREHYGLTTRAIKNALKSERAANTTAVAQTIPTTPATLPQ